MHRLYHIFRAFGTRALIPALTGGVFRPFFYKKDWFVFIVFALLVMMGCSQQRTWTYKAEPYVKTTPMVNKSVAVPSLADSRENVNNNMIFMYLIPIMPFGWANFNTPEGVQQHLTSGLWFFKPPEDFAKAIAEELNNSGIFKEAFYTNRASEGEWMLHGEINSTKYSGKMYSYCLSLYGPDLWFFGLPAASFENQLSLSLKLMDSKTKETVWEGAYDKSMSTTTWIYSLKPDFNYDALLKDIMKEALPSIKSKLANYPKQTNTP